MKRLTLTLGALLALGACGQSPRCANNDVEGLVKALEPKAQFKSLLTKVVERTQTARMIEARDGSDGRDKLAQAIDIAVERHGAEWERNLIASWQTLGASGVQQVCTAFAKRDQGTFMRFSERVGPIAQSRNEPLLQRAAADVLTAAW